MRADASNLPSPVRSVTSDSTFLAMRPAIAPRRPQPVGRIMSFLPFCLL